MRVVVAVGGDALLRRGEPPDACTQITPLAGAAPSLAWLAATHEVAFVHGNGPQVDMRALESAAGTTLATPYAFGELVAQTQGAAVVAEGLGAEVLVMLRR